MSGTLGCTGHIRRTGWREGKGVCRNDKHGHGVTLLAPGRCLLFSCFIESSKFFYPFCSSAFVSGRWNNSKPSRILSRCSGVMGISRWQPSSPADHCFGSVSRTEQIPSVRLIEIIIIAQRCSVDIERVGGPQSVPVDIKIIAATNRNPEAMIRSKRYREDLWFRLDVFPIRTPPLVHDR